MIIDSFKKFYIKFSFGTSTILKYILFIFLGWQKDTYLRIECLETKEPCCER